MVLRTLICAAVVLSAGGCGFPQAKLDEAKGLVQEGLESWKKGGKPGDLMSLPRPVEFHEALWNEKGALLSYEMGRVTYKNREKVIQCEVRLTVRIRKGKQKSENVVYNVTLESPVKIINNPMP